MTTKLERLEQKQKQVQAQIKQEKARAATTQRKQDTRRKVLIGAAILAAVERGEWSDTKLKSLMDKFLTRPDERQLFDLPVEVKSRFTINEAQI